MDHSKVSKQLVLCLLMFCAMAAMFLDMAPDIDTETTPIIQPMRLSAENDTSYGSWDADDNEEPFDLRKVAETMNVDQPFFSDFLKILRKDVKPVNLIKVKPFNFLPNYRNPCWKVSDIGVKKPQIRCMPYYYLIGAPKCGTTDLFRRMVQHPQICENVKKENHWLTRKRFYRMKGSDAHPELEYYYDHNFKDATARIAAQKDKNDYHPHIVGDHSASTMWDNDYWTILPEYSQLKEPLYVNSDYIHHLNPDTKIIAMLRNPIDRLYSDYLYFKHGNEDPVDFHIGVLYAIQAFAACRNTSTIRQCIYMPSVKDSGRHIRLRIGVYYHHLLEWYRLFPKEQILVIKLEAFHGNTISYMKQIFHFLGISKISDRELVQLSSSDQKANSKSTKDSAVGDMLPETRKLLQDFFRPFNEELGEMLGDLFNYNNDEIVL